MAIRKPTKAAGATGKKKPTRDPTEPSDSEMIARECLLSPSFQGAAAIQAWEGFAGKTNFSDLVELDEIIGNFDLTALDDILVRFDLTALTDTLSFDLAKLDDILSFDLVTLDDIIGVPFDPLIP